MLIEQTEIAKRLGISNKKFRAIMAIGNPRGTHETRIPWTLINNKRHYEWEDVLALIQTQSSGEAV